MQLALLENGNQERNQIRHNILVLNNLAYGNKYKTRMIVTKMTLFMQILFWNLMEKKKSTQQESMGLKQLVIFPYLPTICDLTNIELPKEISTNGQSFFPQLIGKNKSPGKWTYCWYAPRDVDDKKAKVFARNHQYKLYRSGEFYDVKEDFNEKNPIPYSSFIRFTCEFTEVI